MEKIAGGCERGLKARSRTCVNIRISFPALERTQGAEGLRSDAKVALFLLDRLSNTVSTPDAPQQLKSAYTGPTKRPLKSFEICSQHVINRTDSSFLAAICHAAQHPV